MLDPNRYALSLVKHKENRTSLVRWLDCLNRLYLEHKQLLKTIDESQLNNILSSLDCPAVIIELLLTMRENKDLSLLPRVAASFRRRLAETSAPVIDVTLAEKSEETLRKIQKHFGEHSVIVDEIDQSLLAGVCIATPNGTYEYSLKNRLNGLAHALRS